MRRDPVDDALDEAGDINVPGDSTFGDEQAAKAGIPDVWFSARCPLSDEELEWDEGDGWWCPTCQIQWDRRGERGMGPVLVQRVTVKERGRT